MRRWAGEVGVLSHRSLEAVYVVDEKPQIRALDRLSDAPHQPDVRIGAVGNGCGLGR